MKIVLLSFLSIILLFNSTILSQKTDPTAIVIKVTFADPKMSLYKIFPRAGKSSRALYSQFPKIPEIVKTIDKSERVSVLGLTTKTVNGVIKLNVSVYIGEQRLDDERLVASYAPKVNDKIVVKELEKFGVTPIKISVIRVSPTAPTLPTVVNETKSLQVYVEPNHSQLPSFRTKFINSSGKSVKALSIETKYGTTRLSTFPLRKVDGRDLINIGETYERPFQNDYRNYAELRESNVANYAEYTFNLKAAVFSDGSFEGKTEDVRRLLGYYQSEQIFIRQTLPILYELSNENNIEKISLALSNIDTKIDYSNLQNLYNKYPDMFVKDDSRTLIYIQSSINRHKKRLIMKFNQFKRNANTSADTKTWLNKTISRLEAQLKRIDFIK